MFLSMRPVLEKLFGPDVDFPTTDKKKTRKDLGPEYGPDYARYSDPPNLFLDSLLRDRIKEPLKDYPQIEVVVRNGFVVLKGTVKDEGTRTQIVNFVSKIPGVVDVINGMEYENI